MKRRQTYRARFWNAAPIRISATCQAQAVIIAKSVAAKHGWKFIEVGRI